MNEAELSQQSFENLIQLFNNHDHFIISGHENPDPDAICSCIALEYLLTSMGKTVYIVNSDPVPFHLVKLDYRVKVHSTAILKEIGDLSGYVLIIVDTNDTDNIGDINSRVLPHVKKYFYIDHHSYKQEDIEHHFIRVNASSTCEIIYSLYEKFEIDIPKEVADAIYAGILFDSGSFHYPKTTAYTLLISSKLIERGVNPNEIYLLLYENESIESLKIYSSVMSTLELYHDDKIAVISMDQEMLKKSGAKYDETSLFINLPLKSHQVQACIFFKENLNGVKRVSMRSKGNIDVASLALNFEGGGHKNAAGFKIPSSYNHFNDIKNLIIDFIKEEIEKNT